MNTKYYFSPLLLIAFSLLSTRTSYAQDEIIINNGDTRLAPAGTNISDPQPIVNSLVAPDTSQVEADSEPSFHRSGAMTKEGIVEIGHFQEGSKAFGEFGIPYTTTRVQDGKGPALGARKSNRLSTTYPYRTVGKLNFSVGYCSARLIRKSVIVTAAHCIQSFGSGDSIFSDFIFIPGHYGAKGATGRQIRPYGKWKWAALVRPSSWAEGTDIGSGSARDNDLAVIALKKKNGKFLGQRIGYLG
ncbi:MAG: hypothetical protein D3923_10845, partial [Candidatus Electrothrix sp. AR3]|nr:hypothetical protein [Candidatus Electrothrix sp. AR3]